MTDQKEAGRAALVAAGANAFGVSATARGDGTLIQALPMRPLTRLEVANLSAWLTMVAMLTDADILPTLRQHGYVLPPERQPPCQCCTPECQEAGCRCGATPASPPASAG